MCTGSRRTRSFGDIEEALEDRGKYDDKVGAFAHEKTFFDIDDDDDGLRVSGAAGICAPRLLERGQPAAR